MSGLEDFSINLNIPLLSFQKAKPKNKVVIRHPAKPFISGHQWKPPTILNRMPEPEGVKHMLEMDRELPPKILEVACKQGEDPEKTCQKVQELRDMIYGWLNCFVGNWNTLNLNATFLFTERGGCEPHRMDDDYLIRFLRARFWKVENAYKLV